MEQTIEELLNGMYGESFKVTEVNFSTAQGHYKARAHPIGKEELEFTANYKKKTGWIKAYYPAIVWQSQATAFSNAFLGKFYDKFTLRSLISFPQLDRTFNPVPPFIKLIREEPASVELTTRMYIFQDIDENNYNEVLKGVHEYLQQIRTFGVKKEILFVHFYDEAYFADKDLAQYQFGFNVQNTESFERGHRDYCRGKIQLRMKAEDSVPVPTKEQLFKGISSECFKHKWMSF